MDPFLNIAPISANRGRSWSEKCMSVNERVYDYLSNSPSIRYVVLSSAFHQYLRDGATVLNKDGYIFKGSDVAHQSMLETISKIRKLGKIPVVFSPTPQNGLNIGACLKKAAFFDLDSAPCDVELSDSLAHQSSVWSYLSELKMHVTVVHLPDFLCADNICSASMDNIFIYSDSGHLAPEGSAYLGKKFDFYGIITGAR
jgi:hypothetical protein